MDEDIEQQLTFAVPDRPSRRGVSIAERGVIGRLPLGPGIAGSGSARFALDVLSSIAESLPKPALVRAE